MKSQFKNEKANEMSTEKEKSPIIMKLHKR